MVNLYRDVQKVLSIVIDDENLQKATVKFVMMPNNLFNIFIVDQYGKNIKTIENAPFSEIQILYKQHLYAQKERSNILNNIACLL